MRRRWMKLGVIWALVLMVGVQMPTASVAQDGDIEWRYAFNIRTGQLVSYSLDGQTNDLIEMEGLLPRFRFDFANESAFIELQGTDSRNYYRLTPDSAEQLPIDPAFEWFPVVKNERYLVLHGSGQVATYAPNLLYDSQTGQVIELQGVSNWPSQEQCCAFLADGGTLRYLSFASEASIAWSIIERDLESGEEKLFFAPDVDFSVAHASVAYVNTDTYGERWLWRYSVQDEAGGALYLAQADGVNTELEVFENRPLTMHRLIGEFFIQRPATCDGGCSMTVQPFEGESVSVQANGVWLNDLIRLGETQFLTVGDEFWLFSADEGPLWIGARSVQYVSIEPIVSPDGRWLMLVDDAANPSKFFIWDTAAQSVAYEMPIPTDVDFRVFSVVYDPTALMFAVLNDGQESVIGLDYATAETFSLPTGENERRRYVEILADGSALYYQVNQEALDQSGIWRYDPETDAVSPILTGGLWQPIRFLQNY